jgi:hypothetical protein
MKYLVGLCFLTCSVVPSFGTTINFDSPSGALGTTQAYGAITASGYNSSKTPINLFGKTCAGVCDENGLGISGASDNEIVPGTFIQLDVTSLQGLTVSFVMNSSTSPDAWSVFESSSALATSGSSTVNGTDEGSHTITIGSGMKYLDFTATAGNVLLSSITYTATPEPLSLALTGSGLLGLVLLRRRKAGSPKID